MRVVSDTLARTLCFRRAHVSARPAGAPAGAGLMANGAAGGAAVDPRILVFEYAGGMVLRPPQVRVESKIDNQRR